jgi:hypothetical protein
VFGRADMTRSGGPTRRIRARTRHVGRADAMGSRKWTRRVRETDTTCLGGSTRRVREGGCDAFGRVDATRSGGRKHSGGRTCSGRLGEDGRVGRADMLGGGQVERRTSWEGGRTDGAGQDDFTRLSPGATVDRIIGSSIPDVLGST